MDFSKALYHIKEGKLLTRNGWNGKDQYVFLVKGSKFTVNRPPLLGIFAEGTSVNYAGHIDMCCADGTIVPWLASQLDLLAHDWSIVT